MPYTNQVLPGPASYSANSMSGNSYQMQAPRMPPTSPYGSNFQDNQLAPNVEYSWNSFNGDYKDCKFGLGLTERWYCELCSTELPNEGAWQLVSGLQYLCMLVSNINL